MSATINERIGAAEALEKSLRTGELSAAQKLEKLLRDDVVLVANTALPNSEAQTFTGKEAVLPRVTGNWAVTYALRHARWAAPVDKGGAVELSASFEHLGGHVPAALVVELSLDAQNKIARIEIRYTPRQPQTTDIIPPGVRPIINNARLNETPFVVAHTDENGNAVLTFRGGIQVWSDTELCAWIRSATGGIVRSIAKNPTVSLAYRDGPDAQMLIVGRARIETDPAIRNRVFDLLPEVEQNHDPLRKGAAMIIDVERIQGFSTAGEPVRMARKLS